MSQPFLPAGYRLLTDEGAILANGNFCRITKAVHEPTGRIVAVKWAPLDKPQVKETLQAELEAITQCYECDADTSATCIVRALTTHIVESTATNTQAILLEFAHHGSLASFRTRHIITERQAQYLARQLLIALSTLHQCGYAHRDVKPHNILIFDKSQSLPSSSSSNAKSPRPNERQHSSTDVLAGISGDMIPFEARLADFGLAKVICNEQGWARQCSAGDFAVMDPAIIDTMKDKVNVTYEEYAKNDVYGVGLAVYFALTGRSLNKRQLEDWRDDMFNPKNLAPAVSDDAWQFVSRLLSDCKDRPFAWEALRDPWVSQESLSRQPTAFIHSREESQHSNVSAASNVDEASGASVDAQPQESEFQGDDLPMSPVGMRVPANSNV